MEAARHTVERWTKDAEALISWIREAATALDRAETRNAADGYVRLTEEERRMVLTALGDVWCIQPDDEPNPHAATLLFRRLSTERSGDAS